MAFSPNRVFTIVLRNIMAERRSLTRMADFFFWPLMDIAVWGITSQWFEQTQAGQHPTTLIIITGLVLWQVVMRSMFEISIGMIEEVWNRSLVNLFATPLTRLEWICAVMFMGLAKTGVVLAFGGFLAWLFYGLNIFCLGLPIFAYLAVLVTFGWALGFAGAAIIIQIGQRVGSLPWMLAYVCAPLCAVYYPVSILPRVLQIFSYCLPPTYVFEAVRHQLMVGTFLAGKVAIGFGLAAVYTALALIFFNKMFDSSLNKGLARLE